MKINAFRAIVVSLLLAAVTAASPSSQPTNAPAEFGDAQAADVVSRTADSGHRLAKGADAVETALHRAAKSGLSRTARALVEDGADVNLRDHHGCTPIHYAALRGEIEIVRLLVEHGAVVDLRDDVDLTPLFNAVLGAGQKGNLDVVRYLIEHGADPNRRFVAGGTCLLIAIELDEPEMVRLLIEKGANVNFKDDRGTDPLQHAMALHQTGIADLLRTHGATELQSSATTGPSTSP